MSGTSGIPVVLSAAGRQTQTPAALNAQLIALVTAMSPGYTANLPGIMIEDISSTDTGALVTCDQAVTDLINSISPYAANLFILIQLGNVYGIGMDPATTTSVYVVFTGTVGFVIPIGFTVSDGTYQYTIQDGGIIGAGGTSPQLFCLATVAGTWAVPIGTVTQLITGVPTGITLTVTNPATGTPGAAAETPESFRARVLQAGYAPSQGMTSYLKTLLGEVAGVQPRLIRAIQQSGGGWEIIVGGGDPYQVAAAILEGIFDISTLAGSVLLVSGITTANPGVVTTVLNHGYVTGQSVTITGVVGMTGINGVPMTVTVITEKTFSIINTSSSGTYTSGGVCLPNSRNILTYINQYPDTYAIPFVNPPQQTVAISVTWNTSSLNYVSPAAVAQLAVPALVAYVNTLPVGVPMNLFVMQSIFAGSIASLLPAQLLTVMEFAVSINGVGTSPISDTGIIPGDPESYFLTNTSLIAVAQG